MFIVNYKENNIGRQMLIENKKLLDKELNNLITNEKIKTIHIRKYKENKK